MQFPVFEPVLCRLHVIKQTLLSGLVHAPEQAVYEGLQTPQAGV